MTQALNGRRGAVFSVRVTEQERAALEMLQKGGGPRALGPWLVWRALGGASPAQVLPNQVGHYPSSGITRSSGYCPAGEVVPARSRGQRLILDLCSGSGSWSEPYERAGYEVMRVTLPEDDVRTFRVPIREVWGVLAAPPCDQFSLARNGHTSPRDFIAGMACVNACLRIVLEHRFFGETQTEAASYYRACSGC